MSMNDTIMTALGEYMRARDVDVVEILDWDDSVRYGGYCETCSYEYIVVEVTYINSMGLSRIWEYDGTFSDLMKAL